MRTQMKMPEIGEIQDSIRSSPKCRICIGLTVLSIGLYLTIFVPLLFRSGLSTSLGTIAAEDPFISIFTSLIAIAGGGLISWRIRKWWTAPILRPAEPGIILWRPHNFSAEYVYRIPVENIGRRSAKNCKAHIHMEFGGKGSYYLVKNSVTWAEPNNANSVEINADEVSYVNFLIHQRDTEQIRIPSSSDLEGEGVILEYQESELDSPPEVRSRIHPTIIRQSDDKNFFVRVTSENAQAIQISFRIEGTNPLRVSIDSFSLPDP